MILLKSKPSVLRYTKTYPGICIDIYNSFEYDFYNPNKTNITFIRSSINIDAYVTKY